MEYIWQKKGWPDFTWDSAHLLKPLGDVRFNQGVLTAQVREMGFDIQQTACTIFYWIFRHDKN